VVNANQGEVRAAIPINFFRSRDLTIFNGELLKGGAFRLRAVGSDSDGNPRRSRDYLFFCNGMYSMINCTEEVMGYFHENGIWGFVYVFTRKPNANDKGFYWEVKSVKGDNNGLVGHSDNVPRLEVTRKKPSEKAIVLASVEDSASQYIYIG